jgi:osmotically-inducible protein OsmY
VDDADVTAAVRRELRLDPAVPASQLGVASRNGIVDITGSVDNLLAKERATRRAEAVKGVRVVANRTTTGP